MILADEPTGPRRANSQIVIDLLLSAQRESGTTLVVVTHDPEVARRLGAGVVSSRRAPRRAATAAPRSPGGDSAMLRYVRRDLLRNPRRTLAALVGVTLGVGLFSGVLFFIDGSGATMTSARIAPLTLDMQRVIASRLGPSGVSRRADLRGRVRVGPGQRATVDAEGRRTAALEPANEVVMNDEPPPTAHVREEGRRRWTVALCRDVGGGSPLAQGLAGSGLNIGRLTPGAAVPITYDAPRARRSTPSDRCGCRAGLEPRGRRAEAANDPTGR